MTEESILWRRLDAPGHDACRLGRTDDGWYLEGGAAFGHDGVSAWLSYHLTCDRSWRTQQGEVLGWLGVKAVSFTIARSAEGVWSVNGAVAPGLAQCVDLDLGFTPATNLFQLRRLALAEGQAADNPVAWLDVSAGTLDVLHQRYARRTEATYWYEAPRFEYEAMLDVAPSGFVRRYPRLWEEV